METDGRDHEDLVQCCGARVTSGGDDVNGDASDDISDDVNYDVSNDVSHDVSDDVSIYILTACSPLRGGRGGEAAQLRGGAELRHHEAALRLRAGRRHQEQPTHIYRECIKQRGLCQNYL